MVIAEIKHLKNYVALFLELYRQRISTLTRKKLELLSQAAKLLDGGTLDKYFRENEEEFYAFFNANRRLDACLDAYFKSFKKLVDIGKEYKELGSWLDAGGTAYAKDKTALNRYTYSAKVAISPMKEEDVVKHLQTVTEIYEAMELIRTNTKLSRNFTGAFGKVNTRSSVKQFLSGLYELHDICSRLFMDYNADSFNSMCIRAANGYTKPVLKGLLRSVASFYAAEESFLSVTNADRKKVPAEDVLEYYTAKAGALIDNIDLLANWCMYRATAEKLDGAGLTFMTDALENGSITGENIVDSFEKNIYKNFLQTNIPLDPVLSRFSATLLEEETESLRLTLDEFARLSRESIRAKLISRLPTPSTEGALSLEVVNFQRLAKANLRGMGLRKLFEEIPELLKVVAPCMLMSPITVSQYLQPENGMFDMVIFDEASQMPTAEAIGSLARAKCAVVVGDPKQLPAHRVLQHQLRGRGQSRKRGHGERSGRLPRARHPAAPPHLALPEQAREPHRLLQHHVLRQQAVYLPLPGRARQPGQVRAGGGRRLRPRLHQAEQGGRGRARRGGRPQALRPESAQIQHRHRHVQQRAEGVHRAQTHGGHRRKEAGRRRLRPRRAAVRQESRKRAGGRAGTSSSSPSATVPTNRGGCPSTSAPSTRRAAGGGSTSPCPARAKRWSSSRP